MFLAHLIYCDASHTVNQTAYDECLAAAATYGIKQLCKGKSYNGIFCSR